MSTITPRTIAGLLALRDVDDYPTETCVAWMEAADRVCGKPATDYLCRRHHTVADRRLDKLRAEVTAEREKEAAWAANQDLPALRAERDEIAAKRDRAASFRRHDTDDMAAYLGQGVRQTPKQQRAYWDRLDRELEKAARLDTEVRRLEQVIARAEQIRARSDYRDNAARPTS